MKIIFTTIPMKDKIEKLKYPVQGYKDLEYEHPVIFPVNAVLAKTLQKGERVKVVQLMNDSGSSKKNAEIFKTELKALNEKIGADISFFDVIEAFEESKEKHESRFRKLLDYLEPDAKIIADITFGQKTLPIVLFCVLNFAEKFFNAEIKHIIYGKAEFEKGEIKKGSQCIFDLTPLYYLNTLTSAMEASDGKSAIKTIDKFFAL
ncbi:hypothetical protein E4O04_06545 [Treponema sp. OMZ 799]|uniref:TM1812 family CRISPR-associated protein n=1 Tax=Treponema sp. OMZ 799 TaxID=2563668 RepID=UPI0020A36CD1|nr:TM1812 family CRISPR-associated protein [Treponema sp. OMZ 799]UTC77675.1 hypothetical protein E4O04_06545 [Treponema sp. OMZ 799]